MFTFLLHKTYAVLQTWWSTSQKGIDKARKHYYLPDSALLRNWFVPVDYRAESSRGYGENSSCSLCSLMSSSCLATIDMTLVSFLTSLVMPCCSIPRGNSLCLACGHAKYISPPLKYMSHLLFHSSAYWALAHSRHPHPQDNLIPQCKAPPQSQPNDSQNLPQHYLWSLFF